MPEALLRRVFLVKRIGSAQFLCYHYLYLVTGKAAIVLSVDGADLRPTFNPVVTTARSPVLCALL